MARQEVDYRLGNIIDAWYGQRHVPRRKACSFDFMTHRNHETFGKFLAAHEPIALVADVQMESKFCGDARSWWWCYDYANYKAVFPYFNQSIRHAISSFEPFGSLPAASTADTCVVHFRVGDFINESVMHVSDLVEAATALLPRKPDKFEILNGGRHFRSTAAIKQKSDAVLSALATGLQDAFPDATVEKIQSDNADADFYRMVTAPMLLTGPGSFAICAAAANKNYRLTPALANLNFPKRGTIEPQCVYEDWHTYPCHGI